MNWVLVSVSWMLYWYLLRTVVRHRHLSPSDTTLSYMRLLCELCFEGFFCLMCVVCCCLQVLELLLAMCSVSGLRSLLCDVVFRPAGLKLRAAGRRQGPGLDGGRKAECGLALVQWLSSPVEGAESCSLQTVQLLNELLEVFF